MINIKYDGQIVSGEEAAILAKATQQVVLEAIGENDVFVYADAPPLTVAIEPIEVFVQVNGQNTKDAAGLTETIAEKLKDWKQESGFGYPVNLNVIPVEWHFKIGI